MGVGACTPLDLAGPERSSTFFSSLRRSPARSQSLSENEFLISDCGPGRLVSLAESSSGATGGMRGKKLDGIMSVNKQGERKIIPCAWEREE